MGKVKPKSYYTTRADEMLFFPEGGVTMGEIEPPVCFIDLLRRTLMPFIGDEFYLQGTMDPDEPYPETFATYYITSSEFDDFYDDDANKINWSVSVIYYSSDPALVFSQPPEIIRALKAEGFLPQTAGVNVISDTPTHNGCAMDFIYRANYTNS